MHRFPEQKDIGENWDEICDVVDCSGLCQELCIFTNAKVVNTYTAELIIALNAVLDPR